MNPSTMRRGNAVFCLVLINASAAGAASSGFLLRADYSEWLDHSILQIGTDNVGDIYTVGYCTDVISPSTPSCVTKASGDGRTMLWRNQLPFAAFAMAVDLEGDAYVVPYPLSGNQVSVFVAKLSSTGTGLAWQTSVGFVASSTNASLFVAADSTGRVYVTGYDDASAAGYVVRMTAAGTIDYTARIVGVPSAIAVDGSGSAFVAGLDASKGSFLARLAPDGSAGYYLSMPQMVGLPGVAADPNGNAVVYGQYASTSSRQWQLVRFDSAGKQVFSTTISGGPGGSAEVVMDAAGNAYITGSSRLVLGPTLGPELFHAPYLYPVRNSIAPCGTDWLSVFAPDGSVLQTTYVPGSDGLLAEPIAVAPNSTVLVMGQATSTFSPTQAGAFHPSNPGAYEPFLAHFALDLSAPIFPLACVGNSASFQTGPIAPGEIVTFLGKGLGPAEGIQTEATSQIPFPKQVDNVAVTFDEMPAPLLWVQDQQINAVVPWSLTPGTTTQICLSNNGRKGGCLSWPVAQAAPGVFMVDSTYAAALNEDGTLNSAKNPAKAGSIVSVFATGLGPVNPTEADGSLVGLPLPANVLSTRVQTACSSYGCFGLTSYNVLYAGPAPFLVAGASQINFGATSDVVNLEVGTTPLTGYSLSNPFQVHVAGR